MWINIELVFLFNYKFATLISLENHEQFKDNTSSTIVCQNKDLKMRDLFEVLGIHC